MIVIAGLVLGAIIGAVQGRRRDGKGIDLLHHAAIYGIAGGVLGMLVTVILARTM
jgi:hypothetical protein